MFTLVRIENSRTNAPEIERIPHKDFNSELSAGVAVDVISPPLMVITPPRASMPVLPEILPPLMVKLPS